MFVETEESLKINPNEKQSFLGAKKNLEIKLNKKQQQQPPKKFGTWTTVAENNGNVNNKNKMLSQPKPLEKKISEISTKKHDPSESSDSDASPTRLGKRARHDSDSEDDEKGADNEKYQAKQLKNIKATMRKALGIDGDQGVESEDEKGKVVNENGIRVDKDLDLSPLRRKNSHDSAETESVRPNLEFKIAINKAKENEIRLKKQAEMFKDAQTVYRDKEGKRIDPLQEIETKKQELIRKNEARVKQWSIGATQRQELDKRKQDLEDVKNEDFARYELSKDVDKEMMEVDRFGDPMSKLIKKEEDEPKKADNVWRPRLRCRFPGTPNRFGIPPGHRWDGVDRGNGFERRYVETQNVKKDRAETANVWSMREL